MSDWVEVWRFQEVSRTEGEPQMARVKVATIRGRVDELRSRHTDAIFRTNISGIKQDYGMIFLAAGSDVKANDVLRANGQDFQVVSINVAPGAFGPHHLEIFVDRVEGAA